MTAMHQMKNKASNFFYYHKKKLFLLVPILIFLSVAVFQMVSELLRPDMRVVAVLSEDSIDADRYHTALESFLDYNGSGYHRFSLTFDVYHLNPDDDEAKFESDRAALAECMQRRDATCCFLVDEKAYEEVENINKDYFRDISKTFPNNLNVKGTRYFVKGSAFEKMLDGAEVPEGLAFMMRANNNHYDTSYVGGDPCFKRLVDAIKWS